MYPSGSMITPEPILCCLPSTRLVLPPLPSTGPYPVTSTWTTLGVTRLTSARTELLSWCSGSKSTFAVTVCAESWGARDKHPRQSHRRPQPNFAILIFHFSFPIFHWRTQFGGQLMQNRERSE